MFYKYACKHWLDCYAKCVVEVVSTIEELLSEPRRLKLLYSLQQNLSACDKRRKFMKWSILYGGASYNSVSWKLWLHVKTMVALEVVDTLKFILYLANVKFIWFFDKILEELQSHFKTGSILKEVMDPKHYKVILWLLFRAVIVINTS